MIDGLERIDQSGIKTLVKERLEHPEEYADKPLVIWRADLYDGIQERIFEEVFEEYNESLPEDEKKWFRTTILGDRARTLSDFFDSDATRHSIRNQWDELGVYKKGMIVIDAKSRTMLNEQISDVFESVVSSGMVYGLKIPDNIPVIAFMDDDDLFGTPEKYPNAEQYLFDPDFEEWAQWAEDKARYPKEVIDFMRGDGEKEGIRYRWYNRYSPVFWERRWGHKEGWGCPTPKNWNLLISDLIPSLEHTHVTTLSDLDNIDIELTCEYHKEGFIVPALAFDVIDGLCRYLTKHKA